MLLTFTRSQMQKSFSYLIIIYTMRTQLNKQGLNSSLSVFIYEVSLTECVQIHPVGISSTRGLFHSEPRHTSWMTQLHHFWFGWQCITPRHLSLPFVMLDMETNWCLSAPLFVCLSVYYSTLSTLLRTPHTSLSAGRSSSTYIDRPVD